MKRLLKWRRRKAGKGGEISLPFLLNEMVKAGLFIGVPVPFPIYTTALD